MVELPSNLLIEDAGAAQASANAARDTVGQEDFLRMLVAQLENQDPLNPQDSTEFTAQLATFTSLEQQIAMRQSLDQLVKAQQGVSLLDQNLRAATLIGREVRASGQQLEVTEVSQTSIPAHYSLASDASVVDLEIRDANGQLVRSIQLPQQARTAGDHRYEWDGKNQGGAAVAPGVYSFGLVASLGDSSVSVQPFTVGVVTATTMGEGETVLRLGNRVVDLEDVLEVSRTTDGGA